MINLIASTIAFHARHQNNSTDVITTKMKCVGKRAYNREFMTVHINAGRRTGKTHAMCTLAREHDIIVVHNDAAKRNLRKTYQNCLADVYTIAELIVHRRKHIIVDRVWIDEIYLCENIADTNLLYDFINANLFIKLGE